MLRAHLTRILTVRGDADAAAFVAEVRERLDAVSQARLARWLVECFEPDGAYIPSPLPPKGAGLHFDDLHQTYVGTDGREDVLVNVVLGACLRRRSPPEDALFVVDRIGAVEYARATALLAPRGVVKRDWVVDGEVTAERPERPWDVLLIKADNLAALQSVPLSELGPIDVVYLDPPYNTTEDTFVYRNRYARSAWLAMMRDRIRAAMPLLAESGVVQVAIDDRETASLRLLLDDLFGEENRLASFVVEINPAGQNLKPNAPAQSHEYCHVYAKEAAETSLRLRALTSSEAAAYPHSDEVGRYLWDNLRRRGGNSRRADRPNQWYPLYVALEAGRVSVERFEGAVEVWPIDPKGVERIWRVKKERASAEIASGEIGVIPKAGRAEVVKKTRMPAGKKPKTVWTGAKYSATTHGSKLLLDILGERRFSYPKSVHLVAECIDYWCPSDGLVLDFFAGSGTTAHAVLQLNRRDGGRRRVVCVEQGDHFETALCPRVERVARASRWKRGQPQSDDPLDVVIERVWLSPSG